MTNLQEKIAFVKNVAAKNQFFTATFTKKDGSERVMNCRAGVKKHLKGGTNTCKHKPEILTVYDMQAKGYRNIPIDRLIGLKYGKNEIVFVD